MNTYFDNISYDNEDIRAFARKVSRSMDKYIDHQVIDSFIRFFKEAINRDFDEINKKNEFTYSSTNDDYLETRKETLISIDTLGNELGVLALFKNLEIKIMALIKREFPNIIKNSKKYPLDAILRGKLKKDIPSFDLASVNGYHAYNELRLLCNCIKHDGSIVTNPELVCYPSWILDNELRDLDVAYIRLLGGVKIFICDLVDIIYNNKN